MFFSPLKAIYIFSALFCVVWLHLFFSISSGSIIYTISHQSCRLLECKKVKILSNLQTMVFRITSSRVHPNVQDGAPLTTISAFSPGYTHLQPWLIRVCWGYNYLITRGAPSCRRPNPCSFRLLDHLQGWNDSTDLGSSDFKGSGTARINGCELERLSEGLSEVVLDFVGV